MVTVTTFASDVVSTPIPTALDPAVVITFTNGIISVEATILSCTTFMLAFSRVNVTKSLDADTRTFAANRVSMPSALASKVLMLVVNVLTLSVIAVFKSVRH